MAKEQPTHLYQGEDRGYVFTVKNAAEAACVDITGWALSWMVKRVPSDADASALITKTTSSGIAIAGTFNASPSVNAQVATVTVADDDSTLLVPGLYYHELKRTTAGLETILVNGTFDLREAVHR